jgi:hypothetical protein
VDRAEGLKDVFTERIYFDVEKSWMKGSFLVVVIRKRRFLKTVLRQLSGWVSDCERLCVLVDFWSICWVVKCSRLAMRFIVRFHVSIKII